MPWTLVHPAAVLPLKRPALSRLPFDALILGSMSPDFGYYVGAFHFGVRAHTSAGIVMFCLPSSLVLYALIRHLYAPVIALLPDPHRPALETMRPLPFYTGAGFGMACLAIMFGAATHNVWDSFTHRNGAAVAVLPWLRTPVGSLAGHVFAVCELLQHLSTLAGAVLLLLAYRRWLRTKLPFITARSGAQNRVAWWRLGVLFALALATAGLFQATTEPPRAGSTGWMGDLVRFVIASTTALAVMLIVATLTVRGRHRSPGA